MARILVTGGCGFLGSHLVDQLIKLNHNVIIIDNLSNGYKKLIIKNSKRNFPCGVNKDAKQVLVSFTLFISLVIKFCKNSFTSGPFKKTIPRSSKIYTFLIFIIDKL